MTFQAPFRWECWRGSEARRGFCRRRRREKSFPNMREKKRDVCYSAYFPGIFVRDSNLRQIWVILQSAHFSSFNLTRSRSGVGVKLWRPPPAITTTSRRPICDQLVWPGRLHQMHDLRSRREFNYPIPPLGTTKTRYKKGDLELWMQIERRLFGLGWRGKIRRREKCRGKGAKKEIWKDSAGKWDFVMHFLHNKMCCLFTVVLDTWSKA